MDIHEAAHHLDESICHNEVVIQWYLRWKGS
jgi:hypothetical protein